MNACNMPADDCIVIAGNLIVIWGKRHAVGGARVLGIRERKRCDERIVDFVDTHGLLLVNMWFMERLSHLPIFYSANSKT